MSSDSAEFDGGVPAGLDALAPPDVVAAPGVRRYAGKLVCFFILASTTGLWLNLCPLADAPTPDMPLEQDLVLGLVTGWWELVSHANMPEDELTRLMLHEIRGRRYQLAHRVSYGYLVYRIVEAIQLTEPLPVARHVGSAWLCDALAAHTYRLIVGEVRGETVATWLRSVSRHTKGRMSLAKFAPWVAAYLLTGHTGLLHCVIVTMPFGRRHCIGKFAPTLDVLQSWVQQAAPQPLLAGIESGQWTRALHDPADILDWIDATQYIRNLQQTHECAESWSRIFGKYYPGVSAADLMAHVKLMSDDVLRKARVQLDCAAMLYFQAFFQTAVLDDINIILYVDGSPQHRGVEMFAASMDIIMGTWPNIWWRRVLLPVVALARTQLDAIGKTIALLWQLTLVTGPALLPLVLRRVRGILSDNGVERLILVHDLSFMTSY